MPFIAMDPPSVLLSPKDFVETPDGLIFAVVSGVSEAGRFPAYLRYRRAPSGLLKVPTADAALLLSGEGDRFLYDSITRAIRMQGLRSDDLGTVYRSREKTLEILNTEPKDRVMAAAQKLIRYLVPFLEDAGPLGVTGSLLIGAQTERSDIDLVIFGRKPFDAAREAILDGIRTGILEDLSAEDWIEAHARRGCALTFEEYHRHERRKGNKALIDGIKFDLTLIDESQKEPEPAESKEGSLEIVLRITAAEEAFGFPARYRTDHPEITEILAFSQTYAGQAEAGETVRVRGRLEQLRSGQKRMVVGMNREAGDEFIKREPVA
jgi:uncharacterized protein